MATKVKAITAFRIITETKDNGSSKRNRVIISLSHANLMGISTVLVLCQSYLPKWL